MFAMSKIVASYDHRVSVFRSFSVQTQIILRIWASNLEIKSEDRLEESSCFTVEYIAGEVWLGG